MAVRYEGDAGEPNLELTENTALINSAGVLMGRLSTLFQWHVLDPVDAAERTRNEGVYGYQANRNPFVDRPEFVGLWLVPRLAIEPVAGGVRLRWDNTGAVLTLESSSGNGSGWSTVTNPPALDAQGWVLDLPTGPVEAFYRLRW